jgi:hypothetical protein
MAVLIAFLGLREYDQHLVAAEENIHGEPRINMISGSANKFLLC